ncbi:MAG TPA: 23S rRNA (pseudouridine(1915)-N(3))-methyltransferase RlmH [Gammaproteobacteria bacterium]|nr:23S rRNA (pseudouridine(1915)-N(3))-methyltransferase RlmH [Gammaproteobacteria bacterium]
MRIRLVAAGSRMPRWVEDGFRDYAARMPRECRLELVEVPLARRTAKSDVTRAVAQEGERMLAAAGAGARIIALAVEGRTLSTPQLAVELERWLAGGRDVALLVGGPDGLAPACLARAEWCWSLSPLTLPHPLVRIVVAEQLYRAWTLLAGHPYHR